ncbi:MAG: hypothetical protein ABI761_08115 [Saprospiraceae bacterium]
MLKKYIFPGIMIVLIVGLALDLYSPVKRDFKKFDPQEIGLLDAAMWRSYYEHKPVKLFFQLGHLMRSQFHAPWLRSYMISYYSGKAAFIFKKGHDRNEYLQALPYLNAYYKQLESMSDTHFNYLQMAKLELEWWIVRRESDMHSPEDWKIILGNQGETMFSVPASRFGTYADQRVRAMLMRDGKGQMINQDDWHQIEKICVQAWTSFHDALKS